VRPEEDRSGGFERGGWIVPHFDKETATFVNQVYGRAEAVLFGRRTYEILPAPGGRWPIRATTPSLSR
jgi:dihydrofolate reductase